MLEQSGGTSVREPCDDGPVVDSSLGGWASDSVSAPVAAILREYAAILRKYAHLRPAAILFVPHARDVARVLPGWRRGVEQSQMITY